MRKSPIYLFVLAVALVSAAALASASLVVSAQNTNSSTTMAKPTSKPKPKYRKKAPAMPRCDNTKQEQTDLSGTYTGKLKHGKDPAVDATLTITGNDFTGTMGSDTMTGRITAVTTCGYTAVTMMAKGAPTAMSLRAKKVGNNLTLTSVPGEPQMVTFSTAGAMKAKPKVRRRKPKAKTTTTGATTTTPPTTPKAPPKAKPTPKPKATPKPKK